MKRNVKKNSTKSINLIYLIYLRYLLPIFTSIIVFLMFFVPSYRFIFSGEVGNPMSTALLLSNSWEQARNVLFGTAEQTNMAISFSTILFALIIIFVLMFILSLAVSIWTATVACHYFSNEANGRDSDGNDRRILRVFIPNRIVLSIFTVLSLSVSCLPYIMKPLYWFTYSQSVAVVLEAPDSLIVGGVLVLAIIILSIVCKPIEQALEIDVFAKEKEETDNADNTNVQADDSEDIDTESKERIRQLFDGDKDKK